MPVHETNRSSPSDGRPFDIGFYVLSAYEYGRLCKRKEKYQKKIGTLFHENKEYLDERSE